MRHAIEVLRVERDELRAYAAQQTELAKAYAEDGRSEVAEGWRQRAEAAQQQQLGVEQAIEVLQSHLDRALP